MRRVAAYGRVDPDLPGGVLRVRGVAPAERFRVLRRGIARPRDLLALALFPVLASAPLRCLLLGQAVSRLEVRSDSTRLERSERTKASSDDDRAGSGFAKRAREDSNL